jgi:hypothetical protein
VLNIKAIDFPKFNKHVFVFVHDNDYDMFGDDILRVYVCECFFKFLEIFYMHKYFYKLLQKVQVN